MRPIRRAALPWLALLLSLVSLFAGVIVPAHGAATDDPVTAAAYGARYLASRLQQVSGQPGHWSMTGQANYGDMSASVPAALALAAAGAEGDAFAKLTAFIEANYEVWVGGDGATKVDRPGALGQLALIAQAAGKDPHAFGGSDLVQRIQLNQQAAGADDGMYGVANNAAGVFLHSFAMLGLLAAGVQPNDAAVAWLRQQQCDSGGWPAYRALTQREPGKCSPVDHDATAMAAHALAAVDAAPLHDVEKYLAGTQNADGGYAMSGTGTSNANTTALVVMAIHARGGEPDAAPWRQPDGDSPMRALLALQLGCEAEAPGDRGAFRWLPSQTTANSLATSQALWGVSGSTFPLGQRAGAPPGLSLECPEDPPPPPPPPSSTSSPTPEPSATAAPGPLDGRDVERLAGEDRYVSAVEVSRELFVAGPPVAYLATGEGFADALSAGPAAAAGAGPVLLTAPSALPAVVADELARLRPHRIVVLGGQGVVSDRVVEQAESYGPVERVSGPDRYATAAAVSRSVFAPGVRRLLIATGVDFPDALAGMGAAPDGPVLLVGPDQVPDVTAAELRRLAPEEVLVLGGTAAISDRVVRRLQDMVAGTVRRVSGADRYQTAALLLREGIDSARVLYVASGDSFADALAAAAAAGMRGTGILLVTRDDAPAVVLDEVRRVNPDRVLVLGGPARISDQVLDQLRAT